METPNHFMFFPPKNRHCSMLINCVLIMASYLHTKCLYYSAPFLLTVIPAFSQHNFLQHLLPTPIFYIQLCSHPSVLSSDWWNWVYICLGMSFSPEHTAEFGFGSYPCPPTLSHKGIWPFLCYFAFGSNRLLPHLIQVQ